jgi:glycosyltransferase involved in cell wall biosynthesis
MRVAIDARWNYHGGVGVYVSNLIEAVPEAAAQNGIEIVAYQNSKRPVLRQHPNLRVVPFDLGCYSPRSQYELSRQLRRDGIDLYHTPFYLAPFLAPCPVLITIHDLIPFLFPTYGRLHTEIVKAGYRASAWRATHIVAASDTTRREVMRILRVKPEKVTRVYCGLRHNVFHAESARGEREYLRDRYGIERPFVLVLSASNWQTKNLPSALQAIEEVRDRCAIPFQTLVAGSPIGLDRSGWRHRLRNAVVTGPVPYEDLPKLYRNAEVFIALSQYEGFGFPLAEAMACGTACIASTGGSLPEIAERGAIICPVSDNSTVVEALIKLLSDAGLRGELSERAIERASQFSFERFADQLVHLYQQCF